MANPNTNRYVIATIKSWNITNSRRFISENPDAEVMLITDRSEFVYEEIKKFNPEYIFFPHWSWIISKEIYENLECVVFHMTDLPFGRGGSPLQNLLSRGIYKTKISALRVVEGLDTGPIYLKRDLDLSGCAAEIFKRASDIVFREMIPYIIKNKPAPVPQEGKVVEFARRRPEQSDIACLESSTEIYDYIRMLDGEGYPPAFVETPTLRIEFFDASLEDGHVLVQSRIKVKE